MLFCWNSLKWDKDPGVPKTNEPFSHEVFLTIILFIPRRIKERRGIFFKKTFAKQLTSHRQNYKTDIFY